MQAKQWYARAYVYSLPPKNIWESRKILRNKLTEHVLSRGAKTTDMYVYVYNVHVRPCDWLEDQNKQKNDQQIIQLHNSNFGNLQNIILGIIKPKHIIFIK